MKQKPKLVIAETPPEDAEAMQLLQPIAVDVSLGRASTSVEFSALKLALNMAPTINPAPRHGCAGHAPYLCMAHRGWAPYK